MPFNADKFQRAAFEPRTEVVPFPALAEFFGPDEAAEFTVRGLTANELHKAMEAGARNKSVDAVVKAIASSKDQIDSIRKALGMTSDTPGEIAKRLEMLVMGSVAPAVSLPVAVKLAEAFPIEFLQLTNEISDLTGRGADLVKPQAASQPTTV